MTRDQHSTKKGTRTAIRRKRTQRPINLVAGKERPHRSGMHAGAAGRRHTGAGYRVSSGARQYQYTAGGVLPRLRLQTLKLNASRTMALFLAVVMMGLLIWFFVDERFYVYAAEVHGNALATADEVYRASGLHTMSVFYVDRQKTVQNIAQHLPSVSQVRVQCSLPGHVSIQVSEEDVRYIWRLADAAFLTDAHGLILKEDDGAHVGLVVVQDLDNKPVRPGDQVDRVALNAAGRLHGLLPEVQVFEYSAARGISLSDARGWRVYFGDDQRLAEKVATLQAMLFKLEQEHRSAKAIDLRFEGSPYYQ
jgi:cell division septal protein FtsQ